MVKSVLKCGFARVKSLANLTFPHTLAFRSVVVRPVAMTVVVAEVAVVVEEISAAVRIIQKNAVPLPSFSGARSGMTIFKRLDA
jgi:hypothetical protein